MASDGNGSTFNYTVVRQFTVMTVVWGIVGMPSHKDLIGQAKIRILTAYVWGLANTGGP